MYAQYGEETFLKKVFKDNKGLVVDIGAADGIRFSNSRFLIESGWSALLVEPNPKNFNKLKTLYHNDDKITIVNAGCGNLSKDKVTFYVDKNDEHEQLSTFKNEQMDKCKKIYNCEFSIEEVPLIKTSELFDTYDIKKIDFLSIDTEDFDEMVIDGINFNSVDIDLICVEHDTDLIKNILNKNNFTNVFKTTGNIFYMKNKITII